MYRYYQERLYSQTSTECALPRKIRCSFLRLVSYIMLNGRRIEVHWPNSTYFVNKLINFHQKMEAIFPVKCDKAGAAISLHRGNLASIGFLKEFRLLIGPRYLTKLN